MKPTATQKRKLNGLLHEYARLRDGSFCLRCDTTDGLELSHIYPKGTHGGMEFMADNVKLLCHFCHLGYWHANPKEAWAWLRGRLPEDRLERLRLASRTYLGKFDPKRAIAELEGLISRNKRLY